MTGKFKSLLLGGMLMIIAGGLCAARRDPGPRYTSDFHIEDCELVPTGSNRYFTLHPGRFWRYQGIEDGEPVELKITVLRDVRRISFEANGHMVTARARVIEERETKGGELVEVSRNFFARCRDTGNIYYLGEDVDIYQNQQVVAHDGAWLAGEHGAAPGLIMPSLVLLGSRYFQEVAPGVAMDRARHTQVDCDVQTPAGLFTGCIEVSESSALDAGATSTKVYAPGVGLVVSDTLKLVEWR